MEYTAISLRKEFPEASLVFIGPCVAKKGEALESPNVDYVMNYEEFGAWLIATETEISECDEPQNQMTTEIKTFNLGCYVKYKDGNPAESLQVTMKMQKY